MTGTGNAIGNDDDNNIIFTIKATKLYMPVVTLSARHNQKLSKLLSKGSEKSFYWNEYMRMLLLKDLKLKVITYQKDLLITITPSSREKFFIVNQLILI